LPLGVQDLGANRNRPRLRTIEAVDAHDAPAQLCSATSLW
jgi:hypothetical protein